MDSLPAGRKVDSGQLTFAFVLRRRIIVTCFYLLPFTIHLSPKMGRTNDKPLKEAIEQMLHVYKLRRKFDETSLIVAWPEMMGKAVANRTKDIFIRNRKLFIRLESSVIKNDLMMMRSDIIEKMNERAGSSIIDEIIFL